jgi:hypothetical protein
VADDKETLPEPANLRLLRRLVTALTVVMILASVTVAVALVQRLRVPAVAVPEALALPGGARPMAVTRGPGWWAVVTRDGRILIFDGSGALADEVAVTLP